MASKGIYASDKLTFLHRPFSVYILGVCKWLGMNELIAYGRQMISLDSRHKHKHTHTHTQKQVAPDAKVHWLPHFELFSFVPASQVDSNYATRFERNKQEAWKRVWLLSATLGGPSSYEELQFFPISHHDQLSERQREMLRRRRHETKPSTFNPTVVLSR